MKERAILTTLLCLAVCLAIAEIPNSPREITLEWDSPANFPADQLETNLWIKVYHSTNLSLALDQWQVKAVIVGSNTVYKLPLLPGQHFFFLTASNAWGETGRSNIAGTPPAPKDTQNLKVKL